ncbi:MAG: hypothetical protein Q8Q85_00040 [Gemmatimonadales bacterium]|nr:hypothetical protein [Gemmatimonadales bacterium]
MYGNYGVPGVPLLPPDTGREFPLEQPKNLFRYGEQAIWSSQLHIGAAVIANTTSRLFTTPLGQVGQGFVAALSIAETNLKEGGRVPSGVAYDVFGLACNIIQSDGTADAAGDDLDVPVNAAIDMNNLVNVVNNGVLSWDFTQTQVDIAPIVLIGAGGGAYGCIAAQDDANSTNGNANNGNGSIWLYRKHPVALPGNSTFAIVLRYGSRTEDITTNSIVIKVTLLGYYKNVIEIG